MRKVGDAAIIWSADCSLAPLSQVGVGAIPNLCIVARKAKHQFIVCKA